MIYFRYTLKNLQPVPMVPTNAHLGIYHNNYYYGYSDELFEFPPGYNMIEISYEDFLNVKKEISIEFLYDFYKNLGWELNYLTQASQTIMMAKMLNLENKIPKHIENFITHELNLKKCREGNIDFLKLPHSKNIILEENLNT